MIKRRHRYVRLIAAIIITLLGTSSISAQISLEQIDRGMLAVKDGSSGIYVGWRLLGTDPEDLGFNLYRITDGGVGEKVNVDLLTGATNYFDALAVLTSVNEYYVVPVINDIEQESSDTAGVWNQNYLSIPLQRPAGGTALDGVTYTYSPNDASTADLDGDGEYEIILKWDPSNAHDNAHSGYTGNTYLDAYEMDGTQIWRIDLGINVRSGAHYSPFMVYDLDEDGEAELVCRTAPGTKDASGAFLADGPAAFVNHNTDYRNSGGYILTGPEFLTVFKGSDGSEMETIDLEPNRGSVSDWGDNYGNRVDRFLAAVLYLDGQHPSVVWCRGIYTKVEIAAYSWNGSQLSQTWMFKSQEGYPDWAGMGSHNLSVGDVDNDGKDEIVYGHCAIDDDGTGLWSLKSQIGTSTGDAMHLADIIPERDGLERWACGEYSLSGSHLVDAGTGEVIWKTPAGDVGRVAAGDLVSEHYGMECWGGTDRLRSATNQYAGPWPSSTNHLVWWDADLGRELLNSNRIDKYEQGNLLTASGCLSNNGSKSNPSLQADLFGDWREEVIWRTDDNSHLRIYTTTDLTEYRIKTLMHDQQYRLSIAWQNNSYNQPPHTSFYLGYDMFTPSEEIPPSTPTGFAADVGTESIELSWNANYETDVEGYHIFKSTNNGEFVQLSETLIGGTMIVDSEITMEVLYKYYIIAIDADGNESLPSEIIIAFPNVEKPYPPSNITGRMGDEKALIFWDAVQTSGGEATAVNATLMHSYTFDNGTADDLVGGANGTLIGGQITDGKYKATANGQYIDLPAADIAINSYSAITLEAMIYADVDNSDATMMAYFGGIANSVGGNGYFITPDRWDESRTAITCGNLSQPYLVEQGVTGAPVSVGQRHHIVSVLTSGSISLYIDGVLLGSDVVSGNNSIANLSNDKAWLCRGGYTADPTWMGSIDEFNIYDGAMDEISIVKHADNYAAGDVIGYNIYAAENTPSANQKLNTELITDTLFIHNDLVNGTPYYYWLSSVTDSDKESYFSDTINVVPDNEIVVQAEEGRYNNAYIEDSNAGFNGSGFIEFDATASANLDYVYGKDGGWYNMIVRYALGDVSRTGVLNVNDSIIIYTMNSTTNWTNYAYDTVAVYLNSEFDNTVIFESAGNGYGNLDEITIDGRLSGTQDLNALKSIRTYPNPFKQFTNIELKTSGKGMPRIKIFNIYGQIINSDLFRDLGTGQYIYQWDGKNYGKDKVPSGIYFATVFLDNQAYQTIKLMLRE